MIIGQGEKSTRSGEKARERTGRKSRFEGARRGNIFRRGSGISRMKARGGWCV